MTPKFSFSFIFIFFFFFFHFFHVSFPQFSISVFFGPQLLHDFLQHFFTKITFTPLFPLFLGLLCVTSMFLFVVLHVSSSFFILNYLCFFSICFFIIFLHFGSFFHFSSFFSFFFIFRFFFSRVLKFCSLLHDFL